MKITLSTALICISLSCFMQPAWCEDVSLAEHAQHDTGLPQHGLSSVQVKKRFGEPSHILQPEGGQKTQWPVIQRWVYPGFTVYFEHHRVIDSVRNAASNTQ